MFSGVSFGFEKVFMYLKTKTKQMFFLIVQENVHVSFHFNCMINYIMNDCFYFSTMFNLDFCKVYVYHNLNLYFKPIILLMKTEYIGQLLNKYIVCVLDVRNFA